MRNVAFATNWTKINLSWSIKGFFKKTYKITREKLLKLKLN